MKIIKKLNPSAFSSQLLLLMLSADALFIFLHILNRIATLLDFWDLLAVDSFNISYDLGMGETFQYIKEFWCTVLFIWLVFVARKKKFIGWAFLFLYFLLDDMFSFHEGMANKIVKMMGYSNSQILVANLRIKDVLELLTSASAGLVFLLLLGVAYVRAKPVYKTIFHTIFIYLGIFLFFGVGMDIFDRFIVNSQVIKGAFTLFEESGEMLALSFMTAYLFTLPEMVDAELVKPMSQSS